MTEFDCDLFAIRYATRDAQRSAHFIGGDPHDGRMPMDYFVRQPAVHDRLPHQRNAGKILRLIALAPDEHHIVPGHHPLVMKLYPAPSSALEGSPCVRTCRHPA
jgi:hypothetical protein